MRKWLLLVPLLLGLSLFCSGQAVTTLDQNCSLWGANPATPQCGGTTSAASGTQLFFPDIRGTITNQFEVVVQGTAPGSLTVTVVGCMRGGTCSGTLASSSGTTSQILTPASSSLNIYDKYGVTVTWTGGDATTRFVVNRTGTVAKLSGSGVGATSNAAAPIMAYYFTNACPTNNTGQCYFTSANTQIANDCNWASTGTTVTCNTSHFVAGDVGKRVAGYLMTGAPAGIFGCVAGRSSFSALTTTTAVTISTFTSGTQISLSSNPANTAASNQGCLIWGTPDDANASAFETVYSAVSSFCPKVMLAAAGYWFSSPHFSSQPTGCAALPSLMGLSEFGNQVYSAGFELEGRGVGNTVIYIGPDFPNGDPCTRQVGSITNVCFVIPVEGKWSDLQISGGGQSTCQVQNSRVLIGMAVGTMSDITLTNLCFQSPGTEVGIGADLLSQLYQVNSSSFGTICFQSANSAAHVQAFKLGCENSIGISGSLGAQGGASLDILPSSNNAATFSCWGCILAGGIAVGNNRVINVGTGSTLKLYGGLLTNCEAGAGCSTTSTYLISNNGGKVYLSDVVEQTTGSIGSSPVVGYGCAASGSTLYLERSTLAANNNATYTDTAGCNTYDLGGNAPIFNSSSSAFGNFFADGRSTMFSCTGTANASVTNSLYGSGPNVTTTTCAGQTSTLGAGIPFQQARTITAMICTSSATTVSVACTVMVNGSPTSTTCTMTASTRCANVTATAVNPGDLLSAKIVTGAAETGANIKMQVLWQ